MIREIKVPDRRPKLSKRWNRLLQAAILVAAYGFIYQQVFSEHGMRRMQTLLNQFSMLGSEKIMVAVIVVLMIFNWWTETIKWKFLVRRIEAIRFSVAIKAVLTGITISTFTPNRIGEYFGRAFILKKANPVEAIILTIVGSMSQLLVTVLMGTFSLILMIPKFAGYVENWPSGIYPGIVIFILLFDTGLVLFYLNIAAIRPLARFFLRQNWSKAYRYFGVISRISPAELAHVLLLSFIRYCIFFTQFYIALRLFGVLISVKDALLLLPLIYLALAAVPTIALTELGVRGSVAIYIIGNFLTFSGSLPGQWDTAVLSGATLIWIINLAFPAVVGAFFVFNLRFIRR
jgi:hypothetical protein